jgi:hypothetical protein
MWSRAQSIVTRASDARGVVVCGAVIVLDLQAIAYESGQAAAFWFAQPGEYGGKMVGRDPKARWRAAHLFRR